MSEELVTLTKSTDVSDAFKKLASEWSVWDSDSHPQEPAGSGKFHFDYADNHQERVLIICGKATLTPDDGSDVITIEKGDKVVFHRGFKCIWHILEPVKKHYAYYDQDGNVTKPANISCDACGVDCWEDSYYFMGKGGSDDEDLCPGCFKKATAKYKKRFKSPEHQHHGEPIVPEPKQKKRKTAKASND
uniref:(S)-ureidoglycine aminohydrolase cupin domain-containing protein n=1 Tax=Mucochytrium quahogii TaxID=96639 RepID=A0A7S2RT34_9STRA|mmetsp:Transcript_6377/g.10059  ORF Transcript_6377/g.10059 Transcript_6377/m.10059 type:complete len:189 (-) Transcript_6377:50-616(-)|eukprot:CAMPEP_0203761456 /NCGR_PEP_ID=MMETSP0098-20131031/14540_1 /ASSEMBLY_ACC=CAM_ASM_000208 /TAXON_ID=96639 /ORGANISM=" , Strain NY0313808BC1" /LENGTH=188 /DNA_ID=CAMNT_0050655461 /DNA_START=66 /DNA_END=632 /DNA_ORIENTATION=-